MVGKLYLSRELVTLHVNRYVSITAYSDIIQCLLAL